MKRKWIRKLLSGISYTSVLFVFQACYGTPQDIGLDTLIKGQVVSKTSGEPIPNIKVSLGKDLRCQFTDNEGKFHIYSELTEKYSLNFSDTSSSISQAFASFDTVLTEVDENAFLQISLESK